MEEVHEMEEVEEDILEEDLKNHTQEEDQEPVIDEETDLDTQEEDQTLVLQELEEAHEVDESLHEEETVMDGRSSFPYSRVITHPAHETPLSNFPLPGERASYSR